MIQFSGKKRLMVMVTFKYFEFLKMTEKLYEDLLIDNEY